MIVKVDTSKPGVYRVSYKAMCKLGMVVEKAIKVTVYARDAHGGSGVSPGSGNGVGAGGVNEANGVGAGTNNMNGLGAGNGSGAGTGSGNSGKLPKTGDVPTMGIVALMFIGFGGTSFALYNKKRKIK